MIYLTNFDYELHLNNLAQKKTYHANHYMNEEFAYLFFWSECNEEKTLLSSLEYSNVYFENISNVLNTTVKVKHIKKDPGGKAKNWWGKLENIPLELSLNSKIWQSNFFKKKQCSSFLSGEVIEPGFFEACSPSLYRPDYSFAGMGSYTFSGEKKFKSRGVVTKLLKKSHDISCFIRNGEFHFYYNHISAQNSFLGCTVFKDNELVKKFFTKKGIDFENVSEGFFKTWQCLKEEFPNLIWIQLDGIYTKDNQFFINELNYRKSMGQIALKLLNFFPCHDSLTFNLDKTSRFSACDQYVVLTPENSYDYQFTTYLTF